MPLLHMRSISFVFLFLFFLLAIYLSFRKTLPTQTLFHLMSLEHIRYQLYLFKHVTDVLSLRGSLLFGALTSCQYHYLPYFSCFKSRRNFNWLIFPFFSRQAFQRDRRHLMWNSGISFGWGTDKWWSNWNRQISNSDLWSATFSAILTKQTTIF